MSKPMSFAGFAAYLRNAQRTLPGEIHRGMEDIGHHAVARAKEKIGVYQPAYGKFAAWAPLSPATLLGGVSPSGHRYAGKIALGFAPPDNPLLRRGDLRNSIDFHLSGFLRVTTLTLGSTDPVMVFQEYGTANMSPRSVIGATMAEISYEFGAKRLRDAIGMAFKV